MAANNYAESIRRVLLSEGGYVNSRLDPGGPTNYGITLAVYRANGHPGASAGDVRAMDLAEAKRIYKARYADPCGFDDLPAGIDYSVFDYAVNSGVGRANKVLRRVLGLPDAAPFHQVLGQISTRDVKAVISAINAERLKFLQSLSTWPIFGTGWGARVKAVNAAALNMAQAQLPPPAVKRADAGEQGKGEVPKPKTVGPVIATTAPTGAAGGSFGFAEFVSAHPVWSIIILAVAIGVVVGVAEFIAHRWQKAKQDAVTPGIVPVPEK